MKTKTFDCVKMKEECQRACDIAYGGLPLEERRKKMRADILPNDRFGQIFGRFFKTYAAVPMSEPQMAEPAAQYGAAEQAK
jgi:hypothetical protein